MITIGDLYRRNARHNPNESRSFTATAGDACRIARVERARGAPPPSPLSGLYGAAESTGFIAVAINSSPRSISHIPKSQTPFATATGPFPP